MTTGLQGHNITCGIFFLTKCDTDVNTDADVHKDAAVSSGSNKKPIIILDYNKNKGGLDKLAANYICQQMT